MDPERLQLLLQRYFDQLLSASEREELTRMLLESSHAREEFWSMARWNALLRQWGEAEWGRLDAEMPNLRALPAPKQPPAKAKKSRREPIRFNFRPLLQPRNWLGPLGAAAAAALMVSIGQSNLFKKAQPEPVAERGNSGVAVLTCASGAVWADSQGSRSPGEVLKPGWLHLKTGAVQIEFSRGARVILEGPTDIQLVSDNEARLTMGKLRAYVPEPAHGFLVRSADFAVTDLGTEFGCTVPTGGAPEVHVFTGKVALELANLPEAGQQIPEHQAMRINHGQIREIPSRPDLFLDEQELARREAAYASERFTAWRKSSQLLSRHPATLVHLDFERASDWERSLSNRARRGLVDSDATIVGCDWVSGRWPNKGALEFKRSDDRLRATVPGLYESLTLLAWVRVDSLPFTKHSLVMTESFQPGEINWYLDNDGSIGFGIRVNSGETTEWNGSHSQAIIRPENFGSWVLLTTVFDGQSGLATHYLNGQPVGQDSLPTDVPLRLDTFEIGNWAIRADDPKWASAGPLEPRDLVRNFQGRMDEFAILSVPLEPTDIRQIYEGGRPSESGSRATVSSNGKNRR